MEHVFIGNQKFTKYTTIAEYFSPDAVVIILPITKQYNYDLEKASLMDNVIIYEIPMGTKAILNKRMEKYIEYYPRSYYRGNICDFKL